MDRPYVRGHYRLPGCYPAMFADHTMIGEGSVTSLSVCGCTLQCTGTVPDAKRLRLRLLLPDEPDSLPVDRAEVCWVSGSRLGLRFEDVERKASLRLHGFVWDRMLERLHALVGSSR
jgi:hypothetical protein